MKNVRKTLDLPKNLINEIEKFKVENYMKSFTAAIVELVRRGLEK